MEDDLFNKLDQFSGPRISEDLDKISEKSSNINGIKELRQDIKKLTGSINELLQVFSRASEMMQNDPVAQLPSKMDKLIEQNEEIARGLLLLLELHRENLPAINRHTRTTSRLNLRRPSRALFNDQLERK